MNTLFGASSMISGIGPTVRYRRMIRPLALSSKSQKVISLLTDHRPTCPQKFKQSMLMNKGHGSSPWSRIITHLARKTSPVKSHHLIASTRCQPRAQPHSKSPRSLAPRQDTKSTIRLDTRQRCSHHAHRCIARGTIATQRAVNSDSTTPASTQSIPIAKSRPSNNSDHRSGQSALSSSLLCPCSNLSLNN